MSYEAFWSLDYCLSCEHQTTEGPYCSQTCRLADLAKGHYAPPRPDTIPEKRPSRRSASLPTRGLGFVLPPAVDFRTASRARSNSSSSSPANQSPFSEKSPAEPIPPLIPPMSKPLYNPNFFGKRKPEFSFSSGGRGSSTASSAASSPRHFAHISDEARQELQRYDESFNHSRYNRHQSLP